MSRILALLYGLVSYVVFLATFLYAVGFTGDLALPRTIDAGGPAAGTLEALLVNAGLLGLFAIQHSVMARQGLKRWWTRIVPRSIERSTYVLASSLVLILLFWQWRPMPEIVWDVEATAGRFALWALFWTGWLVVLDRISRSRSRSIPSTSSCGTRCCSASSSPSGRRRR